MRKTIIALDFKSKEECLNFAKKFSEDVYFKVGMELFYACGEDIVKELRKMGHHIFLDLKICDIPNTAKGALRSLAKLDVDIINVHAFGGKEMMRQALLGLQEGLKENQKRLKLIAVTVLTSIDKAILNNELGIKGEVLDSALKFASLAKEANLDGVVCSPFEAKLIHEKLGDDFLTVCPGIRFSSDSKGDQKRVATPSFAKEQGCDYIVVGRAITASEDPVESYYKVKKEYEE